VGCKKHLNTDSLWLKHKNGCAAWPGSQSNKKLTDSQLQHRSCTTLFTTRVWGFVASNVKPQALSGYHQGWMTAKTTNGSCLCDY
jgi:hypothetical protein